MKGLEPLTHSLQNYCAAIAPHRQNKAQVMIVVIDLPTDLQTIIALESIIFGKNRTYDT